MEAWISDYLCGAPFFQPPLIGSRDSHLATHEYFQSFYIAYHAFALLDDLIFLKYYIMLCDNCILVLILLDCILPLCFHSQIFFYTDA